MFWAQQQRRGELKSNRTMFLAISPFTGKDDDDDNREGSLHGPPRNDDDGHILGGQKTSRAVHRVKRLTVLDQISLWRTLAFTSSSSFSCITVCLSGRTTTDRLLLLLLKHLINIYIDLRRQETTGDLCSFWSFHPGRRRRDCFLTCFVEFLKRCWNRFDINPWPGNMVLEIIAAKSTPPPLLFAIKILYRERMAWWVSDRIGLDWIGWDQRVKEKRFRTIANFLNEFAINKMELQNSQLLLLASMFG